MEQVAGGKDDNHRSSSLSFRRLLNRYLRNSDGVDDLDDFVDEDLVVE